MSFDWSISLCETYFDSSYVSSNRGKSLTDSWNNSVMNGILGLCWCNLNASESTWLYASSFMALLTLTLVYWKYMPLYISIFVDLCNGETKGACE